MVENQNIKTKIHYKKKTFMHCNRTEENFSHIKMQNKKIQKRKMKGIYIRNKPQNDTQQNLEQI